MCSYTCAVLRQHKCKILHCLYSMCVLQFVYQMAKLRASLVQIALAIIIYLTTQYNKVRKALYMHNTMFNGVQRLWQLVSGGQNQTWESSIVWAVLLHNVPWLEMTREDQCDLIFFLKISMHFDYPILYLRFFVKNAWIIPFWYIIRKKNLREYQN